MCVTGDRAMAFIEWMLAKGSDQLPTRDAHKQGKSRFTTTGVRDDDEAGSGVSVKVHYC